MTTDRTVSPAAIVVPGAALLPVADGIDAAFRRLRVLKAAYRGETKPEAVAALVAACIMEGMDTERRIVGALRRLEYDWRLVKQVLNDRAGTDPSRHLWQRSEDGTYALLDAVAP